MWRSIFYSAVIGWFVLLAITFAASDPAAITDRRAATASAVARDLRPGALDPRASKAVVLISTIGQLFCGLACLTSASRMCFAFSRDRGLPGSSRLSKVNAKGVPRQRRDRDGDRWRCSITLPALKGDSRTTFPFAFFAVVSITVIGLYIAYVIPIYLRWRQGDAFEQAPRGTSAASTGG